MVFQNWIGVVAGIALTRISALRFAQKTTTIDAPQGDGRIPDHRADQAPLKNLAAKDSAVTYECSDVPDTTTGGDGMVQFSRFMQCPHSLRSMTSNRRCTSLAAPTSL